jgi:chemotaxis protein methyltransferase CheR
MIDTANETAEREEGGATDRLRQRDFRRLAEFIESYSGIKMPPSKITMVEGRLRRRVRETGAANLNEYCNRLFDGGELASETVHLIDAVTTNKTEFFREPEHFTVLQQVVLPTLRTERRTAQPLFKVWSAACSTGAEPYTLAMVLAEFGQEHPGQRASILATDLCTEVLRVAARAIYPEAVVAPVPAELRRRYLLRSRQEGQGLVRIVPELRAWLKFGRLNLMATDYPVDHDYDVIFCRNVLIYFDKQTQHAVLQRLITHLRPGGYLFLGHSESLAGLDLPLQVIGNTVFRRTVR